MQISDSEKTTQYSPHLHHQIILRHQGLFRQVNLFHFLCYKNKAFKSSASCTSRSEYSFCFKPCAVISVRKSVLEVPVSCRKVEMRWRYGIESCLKIDQLLAQSALCQSRDFEGKPPVKGPVDRKSLAHPPPPVQDNELGFAAAKDVFQNFQFGFPPGDAFVVCHFW